MTLGVAAIIAAIAIPNVRDFIRNNRLSAVANDLLRGTQVARTEAVKRQSNVVLCATSNPSATSPTCSYGAFRGWVVFQDTNANWQIDSGEAIVSRHDLVDTSLTVVNDNSGIVSYAASGFANPPGTKTPTRNVVICDVRGNTDLGTSSTARAVIIEATGRSRVTKLLSEITTAMTATGACPE